MLIVNNFVLLFRYADRIFKVNSKPVVQLDASNQRSPDENSEGASISVGLKETNYEPDKCNLRSLMIRSQADMSGISVTMTNKFSEELSKYLLCTKDVKKFEHNDAALLFWKEHEQDYPMLASLARVYLCVSAGSAS